MDVIRSKVLGYCMGVRRAVKLATGEADRVKAAGGRVYTIGPLIHNFEALSALKHAGVEELTEPPEEGNFSLIIRAHGIDPLVERQFLQKGANIVDATCPNVKKSQLKAKVLTEAGYKLFIAGEAEHAEINGILGYAKEGNADFFCKVVCSAGEAEAAARELFQREEGAKTALIGQTTISQEEYLAIAQAVKKYFPDLEIVHSICSATKERQQALRELIEKVDAVLIAGSRESANTRRLLEIAKESGKLCALVENAGEIPDVFYTCGKVGLSAGASTPDSVIEEIEVELLR